MLGIFVVVAALMMLLMSEIGDVSHIQTRGTFLELLFEVVSAFGTAGLSTGITGRLSVFGKLKVPRTCYRTEGMKGVMPLDAQANLPERCYSYLLQEWMDSSDTECST